MSDQRILLGMVGRPHGVRGLVHVHVHAADPASLEDYGALVDDRGRSWSLVWRGDGIAELRDQNGVALNGREAAQALVNVPLYVVRSALPEPDEDEFYHADLVGMEAYSDGSSLGVVTAIHDYGAGVSLEIGEHGLLLPFTRQCVPVIDLVERRLSVVLPDEIELHGDFEGKVKDEGAP